MLTSIYVKYNILNVQRYKLTMLVAIMQRALITTYIAKIEGIGAVSRGLPTNTS